MELPSEAQMIENAASHIPEMKDIMGDTKSEDQMLSEEKEVRDGMEQLELKKAN